MKVQSLRASQRALPAGFTLVELLVVMVVIAILASLTIGGFRYAQESSARNRTVSAHGAIRAALEQYKEKFGEYPEPENPGETLPIGSMTYRAGGAHMLYQAITGDGTSAIKLSGGAAAGVESDGEVDASEKENMINFTNLPKSIIYPNVAAGLVQPRILIDGWSRPFQYTKPINGVLAINPTYDLWSEGAKGSENPQDSVDIKRDAKITAPWIKNW